VSSVHLLGSIRYISIMTAFCKLTVVMTTSKFRYSADITNSEDCCPTGRYAAA
jgi:hypothetical protein